MTKFENDSLIALLQLKSKELKENPPKNTNKEAVAELAEEAENLYHGDCKFNCVLSEIGM